MFRHQRNRFRPRFIGIGEEVNWHNCYDLAGVGSQRDGGNQVMRSEPEESAWLKDKFLSPLPLNTTPIPPSRPVQEASEIRVKNNRMDLLFLCSNKAPTQHTPSYYPLRVYWHPDQKRQQQEDDTFLTTSSNSALSDSSSKGPFLEDASSSATLPQETDASSHSSVHLRSFVSHKPTTTTQKTEPVPPPHPSPTQSTSLNDHSKDRTPTSSAPLPHSVLTPIPHRPTAPFKPNIQSPSLIPISLPPATILPPHQPTNDNLISTLTKLDPHPEEAPRFTPTEVLPSFKPVKESIETSSTNNDIPAQESNPNPTGTPQRPQKRSHPSLPQKPIRILFAEDSLACRLINKKIAQHAGVKCDVVEDGLECLNLIQKSPSAYDLILMDIIMPIMDGVESAERIIECGFKGPIVPLSGVATLDMKQRCLTAGMCGFIEKPLTVTKLKGLLVDHGLI